VGAITDLTCPPGAACISGFRVDGVLHAVSCGAVRADAVSDHVVARGTWRGRPTEVRRIDGIEPSLIVAIDRPGGMCDEGDTRQTSPWSLGFPEREDVDNRDARRGRLLHLAVCRVSPDQQRRRNRCPVESPRPTSPQVQAQAPLAAYDEVDWPTNPSRLTCERGMGRTMGVPASSRSSTFATAAAALAHAEESALGRLTGRDAAATLTPAWRQLRPDKDGGYEELFFRSDVTPVAWLSVTRAPSGSWRWDGYLTCRPES
jgi:hypothetical protein